MRGLYSDYLAPRCLTGVGGFFIGEDGFVEPTTYFEKIVDFLAVELEALYGLMFVALGL